jgi:hypothetical protein
MQCRRSRRIWHLKSNKILNHTELVTSKIHKEGSENPDNLNMKKFKLNETGDRSIFRVPEDYFAGLEMQLNERIEALEVEKKMEIANASRKRGGIILTMQSVRPILYMAAMFVLLLFSIALVFKYTAGSGSLRAQEKSMEQTVPTAEDYLISSVGTYGISQYYVESQVTE